MRKNVLTVFMFALVSMHMLAGCSGRKEQSALYILEELETAAAVEDHETRVERLEIFINNHPDHRYRVQAYGKILKTLAGDIGDMERAEKYFDDIMKKESDPAVRGMLHYEKFVFLWEADKERALELAKAMVDGDETYYRLFLYVGYYLYGEDAEELTERYFIEASSLARNSYERSQAYAVLGSYLAYKGKRDEAIEYLEKAGNNAYAKEMMGKILWEEGKKKEALESYIDYIAVIPAARESVHLDSLYALVYPGSEDLDRKIMERRIMDEGSLPTERFVDLNGRGHNFAKYKGKKLVINVWSPT